MLPTKKPKHALDVNEEVVEYISSQITMRIHVKPGVNIRDDLERPLLEMESMSPCGNFGFSTNTRIEVSSCPGDFYYSFINVSSISWTVANLLTPG